jgi:acyl transferase domain-containing protein/phospholipid N-methyltransferase/NADP-dependent 3-hydroxy acid dehydrogenase YdfG
MLSRSFGFGGTNAHCILETYSPKLIAATRTSTQPLFTPLVFSAASHSALQKMLALHLDYLKANPDVDMANLAYTLQQRRSTLAYRKAIAAEDVQTAIERLEDIVSPSSSDQTDADLDTRFGTLSRPTKIVGVFTGQGAQWPRMGAELVGSSSFAASRMDDLDAALQSLPIEAERPSWTLKEQLLAPKETSRIAEAAFSQPLCTAVQIILVDLLRAAGVAFTAVVGHSSGEIGAAYAAGFITAQDAIRIAYFRGVHAKLASSQSPHGPRGAMMAIGASVEDAQNLCDKDRFAGRIQVAAVNSSSSITLSGDEDAIDEAEAEFKAQGTFARKLKVDTAYHSAHMTSCAGPYLTSLANCGVQPIQPADGTNPVWYSSVYQGVEMSAKTLTNQYWADNMCNSVLFAGALESAVQFVGEFDMAIEVGPHAALQGPASSTLDASREKTATPYTSLLSRGRNDLEQLSTALGYVWTRLGSDSVQFPAVQALLSGQEDHSMVQDLPPYPFDHRSYWTSSRIPNHFKHRNPAHKSNPVLGNPCSEALTPGEFQWRKMLQPSAMPWLKGHMLQGQTVFPATGYISMAVEAIRSVTLQRNPDASIGLIRLDDINIPKAVAFDDDSSTVEAIFSISSVNFTEHEVTAEWACYSAAEGVPDLSLNASGRVIGRLCSAEPGALPVMTTDAYNLVDVDEDHFYKNLSKIGYTYTPPFQGLSNIRRKLDYSVGELTDQSGDGWDDDLVVHPGMLDSALQTVFAAWSYPSDTSIWSLHVPVSMSAVTINPYFTSLGDGGKQGSFQFETSVRDRAPSKLVGDIYLNTKDGSHAFLQLEGVTLVPFSRAIARDDLPMFSHFQHGVASPDGQVAARGETMTDFEVQMYKDVDRASYYFVRLASNSIPLQDRDDLLPHYQRYLSWCDRMVDMVSRDAHNKVKAVCNEDTRETIAQILAPYEGRKDIKFVEVVGDNLVNVICEGTSMLEHMNKDGLLRAFYEESAICSGPTGRWLARIVAQIAHRNPSLNIIEVGAGTGATTSAVLREIGDTYASYTFTDISSGFFMAAEERFAQESGRMVFKTFNMEKQPSGQKFVEGSYDLAIAVNVLHVSADMEASLTNVRRLLKPGGFLVVAELTSTDLLFSGMTVGTLPGWWIGAETGRPWGPLLNLRQWDSTLKNSGFSGIDTLSPDVSASLPMSVFVAQAVNDQVTLLRNPLAVAERPANVLNQNLAIIGGATLPVYKLGQEVAHILSHRFLNKQHFDTLEDFATSSMALSQSADGPINVLSLVDLDRPHLEDLTVAKFEALKTLWTIAGTVIWVTCGARSHRPFSHMMKGIINTVKTEHPNLSVQLYDLDYNVGAGSGIDHNTANELALTVLREHVLHEWGTVDDLLWTPEPEISVRDGKKLITRLIPDSEKNSRYNAQRRDVSTLVNPANDTLELVEVGEGKKLLELHKISPLKMSAPKSAKSRVIRIKYSLLRSLAVGGAGFLRLCIGTDEKTGETVLALTDTSTSPTTVSDKLCVTIEEDASPSTLVSVASNLLAERVLSLTTQGTTILLNEADIALRTALKSQASSKNVNIVCATAELREHKGEDVIVLHRDFPQHAIQSVIPKSVGVFVNFSQTAAAHAVRDAIIKALPSNCLKVEESDLLGYDVKLTSELVADPTVSQSFNKAVNVSHQEARLKVDCVRLSDAIEHTKHGASFTVVDWSANTSISAKIQPIDSGALFHPEKTYLFVGMAGELGQSLAEWMIKHGARYVVLASRTPKVNPKFITDMKSRYGAAVKAQSLDITSRESLKIALSVIRSDMPPIAGIVNGAMILEDELFANMTLDNFNRVTAPKVLGTQLLDQAFYNDTSLDFFIVTSSIASIIGWTGQSNYSAANEFMTSLVSSRKARGVPGSTVNIPAVLGVGYAAHADNFDFEYFQSLGHINISEQDLHALFAEAILSGQIGQTSSEQVGMGVTYIPPDLEVKAAHKRDVKFNHFIQREEKRADSLTSKSSVRVKTQLQTAKTAAEAYTIARDAFLAHLKRLLRISDDEKLDDSTGLVDRGVDSLVAVDIRAWMLKELGVDVPTLKILGGGPIADLIKIALEKMPELGGAAGKAENATQETESAAVASEADPDSGDTSDSSSPPRSQLFSPASLSTESQSTTAPQSEKSFDKTEE